MVLLCVVLIDHTVLFTGIPCCQGLLLTMRAMVMRPRWLSKRGLSRHRRSKVCGPHLDRNCDDRGVAAQSFGHEGGGHRCGRDKLIAC